MDEPEHIVVAETGEPPSLLECKCGLRVEGPDCLSVMGLHMENGNKSDPS